MPLTSLVGRTAERESVRALLRRDNVRLVTLTGPVGADKNRLALQIAADLEGDFAGGVTFVPLAAVADPGLVLPSVAAMPERASWASERRESASATFWKEGRASSSSTTWSKFNGRLGDDQTPFGGFSWSGR